MAAIVWLGGMVFAHFALRPAAVEVLQPPWRLPLMAAALRRFFAMVAPAVLVIVATGVWLLLQVGMAAAPVGWHIMLTLGGVMAVIFGVIYLRLYPRLVAAVAAADWPRAGAALNGIRQLVLVNLVLGTGVVVSAVLARG